MRNINSEQPPDKFSAAGNLKIQEESQLYKKVGDEYIPVSGYDSSIFSYLKEGYYLVRSHEHGNSMISHVRPNTIEIRAAIEDSAEEIVDIISDAFETKLTGTGSASEEAELAVKELYKTYPDLHITLSYESAYDISRKIITKLREKHLK